MTKAYLYKTIGVVVIACAGVVATSWWQVLAQHNSTPHPVTSDRILESKQEVAKTVEQSEKRLSEQLDKSYTEQRALNEKLDWIIKQMIENARGDNR